ncbi:MAG TPA: hypothetical protein PKE32_05180 [Miltoncostaeaceae bacterium]|nr:hypothetical protein [Miltoncostaeaceae bacterium]
MLDEIAYTHGYQTDGGAQHIVLPFEVSQPRVNATHPKAAGGKLTVSKTGYVAGMMLDTYDPNAHGTMASERLAVWSMDDEQLEALIIVATDALAMRREIVERRRSGG